MRNKKLNCLEGWPSPSWANVNLAFSPVGPQFVFECTGSELNLVQVYQNENVLINVFTIKLSIDPLDSLRFRLYGQKCKKCDNEEFTNPGWYGEEVEKVLNNVHKKIGEVGGLYVISNLTLHKVYLFLEEKMKLADIRYYLVSYTNNNPLFLMLYFQTLFFNELLVYLHFSFSPWRFVFEPKYWANLFKIFIFCFILLFTSSSPCQKDQFAVSYFSTSCYQGHPTRIYFKTT